MRKCKTSKLLIFAVPVVLLLFYPFKKITAQELNLENNTGIGIQINQYQKDFGIGANITSPFVANQKIGIRVRGNLMYHEHLNDEEITWSPYFNASAGIIGRTGVIGHSIVLYGEGGAVGLFPSDTFSSESFGFGGYGLFGFEFYMNPRNNFFIEIGGVGTGARADNVVHRPIYSNGLMITAGFRMHL